MSRVRWVLFVPLACLVLGAVQELLARRDGRAAERIAAAERATVAAELVRHQATVRALALRKPVAQHVRRSTQLAQVVRVIAPGEISVQLTPSAPPERVLVPELVTRRIQQDSLTIAVQAHYIGALEEIVAADSVVIRTQGEQIKALGHDRPRLRFRHGVILGVLGTIAASILLMQ